MTAAITSVHVSTMVEAPIDLTFSLFVEHMNEWWDPRHHIMEVPVAEMVIEKEEGGALFDRGVDGSVSRWGTVIAYEPPTRFAFYWHLTPQWTIDLDPKKASEVHVLFQPEGPSRTRVVLDHRNLERHGKGWETVRDAVGAPESWAAGLARLAGLASSAS